MLPLNHTWASKIGRDILYLASINPILSFKCALTRPFTPFCWMGEDTRYVLFQCWFFNSATCIMCFMWGPTSLLWYIYVNQLILGYQATSWLLYKHVIIVFLDWWCSLCRDYLANCAISKGRDIDTRQTHGKIAISFGQVHHWFVSDGTFTPLYPPQEHKKKEYCYWKEKKMIRASSHYVDHEHFGPAMLLLYAFAGIYYTWLLRWSISSIVITWCKGIRDDTGGYLISSLIMCCIYMLHLLESFAYFHPWLHLITHRYLLSLLDKCCNWWFGILLIGWQHVLSPILSVMAPLLSHISYCTILAVADRNQQVFYHSIIGEVDCNGPSSLFFLRKSLIFGSNIIFVSNDISLFQNASTVLAWDDLFHAGW